MKNDFLDISTASEKEINDEIKVLFDKFSIKTDWEQHLSDDETAEIFLEYPCDTCDILGGVTRTKATETTAGVFGMFILKKYEEMDIAFSLTLSKVFTEEGVVLGSVLNVVGDYKDAYIWVKEAYDSNIKPKVYEKGTKCITIN